MSDASERPRQQQDARPEVGAAPSLGERILAWWGSRIIRLWGATWRIRIEGDDPRAGGSAADRAQPHLAALFHESFLVAAYFFRDRGYGAAVSRSRDGDRIAAVLQGLGYGELARGSSSRGGSAALLSLVRTLERGISVSVLIDGPRGPARIAKPGILTLARQSQVPIQPVGFSARPALRLESWDRALIPLPFARIVCSFASPIEVPDDVEEEALLSTLEGALVSAHASSGRD